MTSMMVREIRQQPGALEKTLRSERSRVREVAGTLRKQRPRLIVLVARGTSDNAAVFGRYLLELETGIPVSLCAPSIHTLYGQSLDLEGALVVGVSQSGEGTDVNVVLENCKKSGATVLAITNSARSSMARIAHETFVTRAGAERSVAATKTYTGQLMVFHMLAAALAGKSLAELEKIPEHVARVLERECEVDALIERYRFLEHCVVVARGLNYANALEFAIKLMETCYIVAKRFSAADFLHGPIAVLERDFPVMLFAPPGPVFGDLVDLARRARELEADLMVISSEPSVLEHATRSIRMPVRVDDRFSAIPYIVPAQLFAAKLAEVKGLSPDRPRGLAKVTKTL